MKYQLGAIAKDSITGFQGTITARAEYLGGTNRYLVEARNSKGERIEEWFDEGRVTTNTAAELEH